MVPMWGVVGGTSDVLAADAETLDEVLIESLQPAECVTTVKM